MPNMLDCIYRIPRVLENIINMREETVRELLDATTGKEISQIVLCGSGTSNTSAVTARRLIEKTTGIQTVCILPEELLHNCFVYRPETLYVFVSHSGTSTLTCEAAAKLKNKGMSVALCDSESAPLVKNTDVFLNQRNGKEEYLMRTIGYNSTVLTLMMMGLELGRRRGYLKEAAYDVYLQQARAAIAQHRMICDQTMRWFDHNHEKLMNAETFVLYGVDSLWGVALEGALKIMEISKRFLAVGYEFDDGMHGPTMGFTKGTCVFGLNDGGRQDLRMRQLMRFVKEEKGTGFLIGENPLDGEDLPIHLTGGEFIHIEFAPVVQIIAYRLAVDYGIDLDHAPHPEKKYFQTHSE